jgi:hypothetical protein
MRRGWPAGGLLLVGTLLWLIWAGEGLYAHFLLDAFRGAPQFFCVVWAFVLLEEADPSKRSGGIRLVLATCVLLAGALIRETVLLAMPGMLAWVLCSPAWKNRRWRGLGCLVAPRARVRTGALILLGASGWGGNAQFQAWWMFLTQMDVKAYGGRILEYFRLMAAAAGWPGWILFALGIWFQRRQPARLLLWGLPAVGLAAFYAVFMVHQRYVLDCYLLLAVVSAAGLAFAFEAAGRRGGSRFRPWILGVGLALAMGLNLQAIRQLPAWGQKISKAEVARLVQTTLRHVPDPSRIWTDGNCRYLTDAAWIHLGALPMPGGESMVGQLAEGDWHYWRRASPDTPKGVYSDDLILQHADLHPVRSEDGQTVDASLGDVPYRLYRISPWTNRIAEQVWEAAGSPLLWLDFQESDPAAERQVRLLTSDGTELQQWALTRGNGLIPLAVEPRILREGQAFRVVVESSGVLPSKLIRIPDFNRGWDSFTMERGRLPSALKWVRPPAHLGWSGDKWGVGITRAARFEFPVPRGGGEVHPVISLLLEPRFRQTREIVFQYRLNGEDTVSFTNRLDQGRFRHELPVSPRVESEFIEVDMSAEVPEEWDNHFRLVEIGYQLQ